MSSAGILQKNSPSAALWEQYNYKKANALQAQTSVEKREKVMLKQGHNVFTQEFSKLQETQGTAIPPQVRAEGKHSRDATWDYASAEVIHAQLAYKSQILSSHDVTMNLFAEQSATHTSAQKADPQAAAARYATAQRAFSLDECAASIEAFRKRDTHDDPPPDSAAAAARSNYTAVSTGSSTPNAKVSTASKQGTIVTLTSPSSGAYGLQITRKDGLQLNLEARDNMRINDLEDGNLSVYFPETGKTCLFDAAGNMTVQQGEAHQVGTSGDDIIVNVTGSHVDGGDGNDTVLNFAQNATIETGEGDDTVFTTAGDSLNIATGNGNDRLLGVGLRNSTVDMGEGNNGLYVKSLIGGELRMGDGNNILTSELGRNSATSKPLHINLGNGNNNIFAAALAGGTELQVGNGNNYASFAWVSDNAKIFLGNGGNTLNVSGSVMEGATVETGDGSDSLHIATVNNGNINAGGGNDSIYIESTLKATITGGSGDDTIYVGTAIESSISGGTGSDKVNIGEEFLSTIYAANGKKTNDEKSATVSSNSNQSKAIQAINRYKMQANVY